MIQSRSIFNLFIVIICTLSAILLGVYVVTNTSGGIVALAPIITAILSLIAIKSPRNGLYALAALVIWVDEFKRLAVYFGGANYMTVIQSLAMPFVVILAIQFGFFLGILFGRVKLDKTGILIYGLAATVGIAVFVGTVDSGWATAAQRAANISGYLSLIPVCYTYLKSFDDWRKFFAFQVIVALPAAIWAIKQYYFGFDQIEWYYANSKLSPTHYVQMFYFENPRVFGFFGSASALGCASVYCAFSWWHMLRFKSKRIFWGIAAIILTWVLIVSTQRTALVYPLLVLVCAYGFRRQSSVVLMYAMGMVAFITGIIFSDYLVNEGLDKINKQIAAEGQWGSEVLKVSTFSDRIMGWQRLKRMDSWSLFGTGKANYSDALSGPAPGMAAGPGYGDADYSHDIINRILINHGVMGLLVIIIPGIFILKKLHGIVHKANSIQQRNDAAFALSLSLPMIFLAFIGGDNFNTNPINIQAWTAFAGVFVCSLSNRIPRPQKNEEIFQHSA